MRFRRQAFDKKDFRKLSLKVCNETGRVICNITQYFWDLHVCTVKIIICCILLLTSSATGVSSNPCSQTYPGTGPFTEKCTQNMRDRILELQTRTRYRRGIQLYMAVHSYSQMWLTPWGFSGSVKPSDYSDIVSWGRIMKSDLAEL